MSAPTGLKPVGIGIIGLGFMGATHIRAYASAAKAGFECRLVAVADRNDERLRGRVSAAGNLGSGTGGEEVPLFDAKDVQAFREPQELLKLDGIDLVSICTPTDSHVELAIAALRAGKHVLVEKPVALGASDIRRLAKVVHETGRLCMPAMCMRFWPGWDWLRERVRDGVFGRVLSATFQRLGSPPNWSSDFYNDTARSGGAMTDLHIHDADFILWCFGRPLEVVGTGSLAHVTTLYRFNTTSGPKHVVAEGGQDHSAGFGFKMRFVVVFEQATVDWDLMRTPHLLLSRNGASEPVQDLCLEGAGYEGQAMHIVDAVRRDRSNHDLRATIDQAVDVAELLDAERRSIETRQIIVL